MRRAAQLALLLAVFGLGAGIAVAALGDTAPPVSTTTQQDAVGDSGSGPDISSVSASVSADGMLSLSMTVANRESVAGDESVQFTLTTEGGGQMMIVGYSDQTYFEVSTGSSWETIRDAPGSLVNGSWSTSISLSDLQSAIHQSVEPTLYLTAQSYVYPNNVAELVDWVPDGNGTIASESIVVQTGASGAGTTTTPPTPTTTPAPPPPTTTKPVKTEPEVPPYLDEQIVRLSHARIEWKRLSVEAVPAGSAVSIACTKACKLSERLRVTHGAADSTMFVNRPFARGVAFLLRVRERDGTGWWFATTVVAKPGGQETTSGRGCMKKSGALVGLASC